MKRLAKRPPPGVEASFRQVVSQLSADPYETTPDKATTWRKAWRDLANHRHIDLPSAWRLCYTIAIDPTGAKRVRIIWIGSHKEYDRLYGFTTS